MAKKLAQSESEIQDFFRYGKFEDLRNQCIEEQGLTLAKRFLNYSKDPVGMYRDIEVRPFCEPFIEYCEGKISLPEGQKKRASMAVELSKNNGMVLHENMIRAFFERYTCKRFDDVIRGLESNDKEVARESAILIVTVFKETLHRYRPIKRLMEEADRNGDLKFKEDMGRAYRTIPEIDTFSDFRAFARMYEDFIRGHSFKETVDLAKKSGVKIEEDSFKKYLHRRGVKKETPGRPRHEDSNIKPKIESLMDAHKKDFDDYLFGEGGVEAFTRILNDKEREFLDSLRAR
jgi:pyoverdine/dityrosine biosynthesis protein Dit1